MNNTITSVERYRISPSVEQIKKMIPTDEEYYALLDFIERTAGKDIKNYAENIFPRWALLQYCILIRNKSMTYQEVLWTMFQCWSDPTRKL